jgi:effector-binding domain-containing protein
MIDTPQITKSIAQPTAVIRLTIPRSLIQQVIGPAIGEVFAALKSQGIAPAGPVFSYHFDMKPDIFDFEVGVPVATPVASVGRMIASKLPARKVARTVYHGGYEGLGGAWGEFCGWMQSSGLKSAPDLWEFYVTGPESGSDSSKWRTELNRPLLD